MKKPTTCVLLTSRFPLHGETFLRYEIAALAEAFDQVEILSLANGRGVDGAGSDDLRLIGGFDNVRYLGDIASLKPSGFLPDGRLLGEALRELPKAMGSGLRSVMKLVYRLFLASRTARLLRAHYPDDGSYVLYAYWLNAGAAALASLRQSRNVRVCRAHNSDIYDENIKSGFNSFQHFSARGLDRVFCISSHGRAYLQRKTDAGDKLELARLGVSLPLLPARTYKSQSDKPLRIVSCSVVDANKRLELLVEALMTLSGQTIHWTHIGDGPRLGSLKALSAALPPGITVRFTGAMDNADIHRLYQLEPFDLFINTSLFEGIPVSAMEAMSHAIPCLATDVGGTSELVVAGAGQLIPVHISAQALGEAIHRFADIGLAERQAMAQACRTKIEADFCADVNFPSFVKRLLALQTHDRAAS